MNTPVQNKVAALVRSIDDLGGTPEEREANIKLAVQLLDAAVNAVYPTPPPKPEPKKKTTSKRRTR